MKIEELSLHNFRRFRRASFSLDDGVNVVKGPNESGKSTMVQALLAAFFWKVDSTRKEVRDSVTWGEEDGFVIEMGGEVQGKPFRLVKDFSSRKALLDWDERETEDSMQIEEIIGEWLGLGSETAFRSTAGIRQDEVAEIAAGNKELSESLQATVTGAEGGRNALQARASLSKDLSDLMRGTQSPAKNPGLMARTETEITEKRSRKDSLSGTVTEMIEARRRLEEIDGEVKSLDEKLESLKSLADDSLERADIEEDIEDFHRRYGSLEAASALIKENEELKLKEKDKYADLRRVLDDKREELGELELRRAGISEGLNIMRKKIEREGGESRYARWAPYLLVVGLTLILVGLAGMAFSLYMLILTGAGLGMVVLALSYGGYYRFVRYGRELGTLQEQAAELERKEQETRQKAEAIIAEAGCDSVERFNELKLGYLELLARRKEIADKLEVLVPDGDVEIIEGEARSLAIEVSIKERRLKELKGRSVEPGRLQKVLKERDRLNRRREELREESIRLDVILREEGAEEELLRTEEELEYLQERRARLERRSWALELALELLEKATRDTLASAARKLEGRIGEYMGRITDMRYSRIQVDEGTFGLLVWSGEKKDEVEPELLSRGTIDQLYLAARLSLVDIICDDRHPPLLLDDPFVTFDSRRLERAMEIIKDFSQDQQVIIFTCGNHYDSYADRVVELEPVTS